MPCGRGFSSSGSILLSPKRRRSSLRWTWNVALIASLMMAQLGSVSAQNERPFSDEAESPTTSPKKLEDTVVTDMLRIVDNKFDTLTTRLTSLERAVSNLQFFSIRQFRSVGGALQEVTKGVESLSGQVGKLEVDGRGLKISSRLLSREVGEMKSMTSTLSDELASSVEEVSNNMDKQGQHIRAHMQDTLLKHRQDSKEDLQSTLENVLVARERGEKQPVNCSVDLSPVHEHLDQRLTQLKRDVYTGVSNLLRNHRSHTTSKCDDILKQYQTETRRYLKDEEVKVAPVESKGLRENKTSPHAAFSASKKTKFDAKKAKQSTTADVPPRGFLDIVRRVPRRPTVDTVQPVPAPPENSTRDSSEQAELNEKDEMIMEALTNMTTSVQQAVSYFRNTAHLLEVILSNTDMLVNARVPQSEDETPLPFQGGDRFQVPGAPFSTGPGGFEVRGAFPGNGNGKLPVGERAFPGNRRTELPVGERIFPGNRRTELPFGDRIFLGNRKTELPVGDVQSSKQGEKNCEVPVEVVGSWSNLMKNGSQLLEVLTDLAQMSAMSLLKATESLENQVSGMDGIRSTLDAALLALAQMDRDSSDRDELSKLTNTTEKVLRLAEAFASNAGWLPLIFHSVKHQDAVGNRTLHFVSQSHGLLRRLVHSTRQQARPVEDNTSGVEFSARSRKTTPREGREGGPSSEEFTLDEQSLATIYRTSLNLHRIMPALTKLLAEPGPLFTLADGSRVDQGRVEVYHQGEWGTLCHRDIGHHGADIICRHLGFQGGISAGAGHFGAGAGVFWSINASCLATAECASINYVKSSAPCNHDLDAAIICDHMLRIIPSDPSINNKTGRLEIHHRGLWLPVCGDGWTGHSARVACQQMGHTDGRERQMEEWTAGRDSRWLTRVACQGNESRLDACRSSGWTESCKDLKPAGVRCI